MTVTRLAFKLSAGDNYIDLAQCMSLVQRTLIRQKQTFTVLGGQLVDNSTGSYKIMTAPNTWYVRAAINRGFKAWKDQRHKALANAQLESGVGDKAVGKYADFKVTLSGQTVGNDNKLPVSDNAGTLTTLATGGEWATASVVDEMGMEKHFRIFGNNPNTLWYGLVNGWLRTRVIPDSESEPDMLDLDGNAVLDYKEDFLNTLNETADGQPERLELLYEDNDNAPFAVRDIYRDVDSGDNLQLQAMGYYSATNPSHMIPGFKALCGLIEIRIADGTSPVLFLDVLNTPEAF
jgi:hypothetical protein